WPRHQGPQLEDGTRGWRTSPSSARSRSASWGGSTASIERTRRRPCGLLTAVLATIPPYIPLGHPPNRARRHKGHYGWTLRTMLWALEEFYVIGTFVPIAPEVSVQVGL
ncbi:unnamed protein product, partial [Ectocarpus sp. 13 AM-2016]